MLTFVTRDRRTPPKRAPELRRKDFREIYERFANSEAMAQASRCSQCGVPFCQSGCPLKNNIPDWLLAAAEGDFEEAYRRSAATNPMPEVCGKICPQDRLCEGVCVIEQSTHGTVTIGAVEEFLTETAWREGWVEPITPPTERGESVGVIGAGPGGLAAAEALRRQGYKVTVYDRYDRPGGLLIYGIPNFKLDKDVVQRRTDRLAKSGIEFVMNFEVGRDARLEDLHRKHDALVIAIGAYAARELTCPADATVGVAPALSYLTASNKTGLGDQVPEFLNGDLNAAGKRVVVVGGGDTAMDCVRTAVRQGAADVTCLYRRDRANMPGSSREIQHAEEEGVRFEWLASPKAVLGGDTGTAGVRAARMRLGLPDASGRQAPEEIPGSEFDLPADLVIKALGFEPENAIDLFRAPSLTLDRWGAIKTNPNSLMTSIPGVFAAGDVMRGASLVVWALRDGLKAAEGVHAWLTSVREGAAGPKVIAAE